MIVRKNYNLLFNRSGFACRPHAGLASCACIVGEELARGIFRHPSSPALDQISLWTPNAPRLEDSKPRCICRKHAICDRALIQVEQTTKNFCC